MSDSSQGPPPFRGNLDSYLRGTLEWFHTDANDQTPIEEKVRRSPKGGLAKKYDCPDCKGPCAMALWYDAVECILCRRVVTSLEMVERR